MREREGRRRGQGTGIREGEEGKTKRGEGGRGIEEGERKERGAINLVCHEVDSGLITADPAVLLVFIDTPSGHRSLCSHSGTPQACFAGSGCCLLECSPSDPPSASEVWENDCKQHTEYTG